MRSVRRRPEGTAGAPGWVITDEEGSGLFGCGMCPCAGSGAKTRATCHATQTQICARIALESVNSPLSLQLSLREKETRKRQQLPNLCSQLLRAPTSRSAKARSPPTSQERSTTQEMGTLTSHPNPALPSLTALGKAGWASGLCVLAAATARALLWAGCREG